MSSVTIYNVFGDRAEPVCRLHNASLGAPVLWAHMGRQWVHGSPVDWLHHDREKMERLWSLALDERVGVSWRIAMALTLDLAYAESERLVHAAVACAEVHCNVNGASHWGEYARLFQKINNQQIPGLMGVAIGHTSANDPWAEWKHPIRDDQLPFQAVEYALMRRPSPYLGPQDVKA